MAGVYRRLVGAILLPIVVAGAAPFAHAATPPAPPQTEPAVAQYVETFPTSGGPAAAWTKPRPVSASVAAAIRKKGGQKAKRLIGILRSPEYGGPGPASHAGRAATPAVRKATPTGARRAIGPEPDPLGDRTGGSLASVVTSRPGSTKAFWLLLLAATALPIAIRIGSRNHRSGSS